MLIGAGLVGVVVACLVPPQQSTVAVQGPEVASVATDKDRPGLREGDSPIFVERKLGQSPTPDHELSEPSVTKTIGSVAKATQAAPLTAAAQPSARLELPPLPATKLQPDPSPSTPSQPPLVVAARPRPKRPPVKPDPPVTPQPDVQQPDARQPATQREEPQPDNSQAGDPAKRAAFVRAATSMRLAMSQRDLAAAKRHVKLVDVNAQTPADHAQVERLQILLENLEEFWKAVHTSVAKLQPLEELELKDNRVAVVEASRDELTIMMYGRHQRYRVESLPLPLLQVIVNRSLAPTASSKIVVATFLAMDREGDRKQARKLWEEAAKAGENQGRQLMPELDVPMPAGGSTKKR